MANINLPTTKSVASLPVRKWGEKADASNLGFTLFACRANDRNLGLLAQNRTFHSLTESFLVRIDVLRALSQVCIDYRRGFLPLLWESLNICFAIRGRADSSKSTKFYIDALVRKCDDLSANPNLASYIGVNVFSRQKSCFYSGSHHRTVRIILTRYETTVPFLSQSSLQNLHTLQVFHAHTQITTAIKDGLQGVVFPRIRTLIMKFSGAAHR